MKSPALRHWFSGRNVCVIGLGKSGVAAAELLVRCGARVGVTEKRPRREVAEFVGRLPRGVVCETGAHRLLRRKWDLIVVSPGVPESVWRSAREEGTPVWGEMELAARVLQLTGRWPERVAAVTGTNGKTTCTALLGAIFRAAGEKTIVAGNIGTPLSSVVQSVDRRSVLVLEVSSYQLESSETFSPAAGTVLNVTPDHLGRHVTMERYARTKFKLFQNQGLADVAVLNRNDPWCRRLARSAPGRVAWFGSIRSIPPQKSRGGRSQSGLATGVFFYRGKIVSCLPGAEGSWSPPRHLMGWHNIENALAAVACARHLGAGVAAVSKALANFQGVEHRLERVRDRGGVIFVNDSKATNVDSTLVALKAFEGGRLHLILGGQHKGSPYTPLRSLVRRRVKQILLIGESSPIIAKDLAGAAPIFSCGTLEKALARAAETAVRGDTVLLSPACASYDQFQNFEHRGRRFKELVNSF